MLHDISADAAHMVRETLRLLRPHTLHGSTKTRVGRFFDGGYVMVDRLNDVEACYSLGINDDVSWDMDMALRGSTIFQYDPTIEHLPEVHPSFRWQPRWIGGAVDPARNMETLESLIRQNGHESNRNMILKCDIESGEWPLLQTTPNAVLSQFRQMVFEFHGFGMLADYGHANNVRRALLNLTASHHVVHVHANNFAPFAVVGGIPVPEVLELTLVRKDEGTFSPSQEVFPTPLDMPCHSREADLYLGHFTF